MHRKICTVPKNPEKFTLPLKIMLNLAKISKQQKSNQKCSRKSDQNLKIRKKNCTINFFPPAIFLHKKQTGEYFVCFFLAINKNPN